MNVIIKKVIHKLFIEFTKQKTPSVKLQYKLSYVTCKKFQHHTTNSIGQAAQTSRRLAMGWTVWVRSRVSEEWRLFFAPSCPD